MSSLIDLLPSSSGREEGIMGTNELDFESQKKPGLPDQTGTPEQTQYQLSPSQEKAGEKVRSIVGAPLKGFVSEARGERDKLLPLGDKLKNLLNIEAPSIDELFPSDKDVSETIEEIFPTEEGFAERALERGGRTALYAPSGVGGVVRSLLAGFAGEGAKEAGMGKEGEILGELLAFASPNIFKKALSESGKYGPVIKKARELGMSDEAIAPLIQGDFKQKFLSKLSSRRGRTQKLLAPKTGKVSQELSNVYEGLKGGEAAQEVLSPEAQKDARSAIQKVFNDIKTTKTKKEIRDAFEDVMKGDLTGKKLIDFYQAANANLGESTAEISRFKDPIRDALAKQNPQLANDFKLTNDLYSKYKTISKRLEPTLVSDLIGASEAIRVLTGITTGYYPLIASTLTEQAGKTLAREMLVNPRLQQTASKMANALNKNKVTAFKPLIDEMSKELQKKSPEAAQLLQTVDEDELKAVILSQEGLPKKNK